MILRFALPLLFALASTALASTQSHVADCSSGEVVLQLDLALDGPLDPAARSLVLIRDAFTNCDADAVIASVDLQTLATGNHQFTFSDAPGDGAFWYRAELRDADGNWVDLYSVFDPVFTNQNDDFAYCGDGPIVIARVSQEAWWYNAERCPGDCGPLIQMDTSNPSSLLELIGGYWSLFGHFRFTIDGLFFQITDYQPAACTVPVGASSWGAVKSRF